MFSAIDPNAYYEALNPTLDVLGKPQTRARLRHERKGCSYIKVGSRVLYHGRDVLDFLEAAAIKTAA